MANNENESPEGEAKKFFYGTLVLLGLYIAAVVIYVL